jgi:hypothetical protein
MLVAIPDLRPTCPEDQLAAVPVLRVVTIGRGLRLGAALVSRR